jgi:hypothetical protein
VSDVFEMFGVEPSEPGVDPKVQAALEQLAVAVGEIGPGSRDFNQEPDLYLVAVAVQDVLEAAGLPSPVLDRWIHYEQTNRRSSKLAEARARADAAYRADLEAIQDGWTPLHLSEQSRLPWRRPEPSTSLSRPPLEPPEEPPERTPPE